MCRNVYTRLLTFRKKSVRISLQYEPQNGRRTKMEKRYILYHRTSTKEQSLERGVRELTDHCKLYNMKIFNDKVFTDQDYERPAYRAIKEYVLQSGDTLVITELDRLGRTKSEVVNEINYFRDNNINLMVLELPTTFFSMEGFGEEVERMTRELINNLMIELYISLANSELA